MVAVTNRELIVKAKKVAKAKKGNFEVIIGEVGCALVTNKNHIYVGVSIDAPCGVGFCAEHSAIASMVTNGEYEIRKIVAVSSDGAILPPCGRCREFIFTINEKNLNTEIILGQNKSMKLSKLLPNPWQKSW